MTKDPILNTDPDLDPDLDPDSDSDSCCQPGLLFACLLAHLKYHLG